jgi:hypothetical protein
VAVGVPDIEVNTEARRRASQPHFDAAKVLAAVEFEVAYV